ncbi:hypothetical protein TWF481_003178 [Arthrobotrys musiformis]|uniref:BTB domain-containing protein n=1 Tax=Arthrobotrys musiformis TaxID=47236 RepID=A0AAV9VPJ2_9PEZI
MTETKNAGVGLSPSNSSGESSPGGSSFKKTDPITSGSLTLARMLMDSEYSDVTVFAGPDEKTHFKLHRAVIRPASDFFRAACKANTFKEGATKTIHLPEILPSTFARVANWLYEQSDNYKEQERSVYTELELFQAANFLQIEPLRCQTLESFLSLYKEISTRRNLAKTDAEKTSVRISLEMVLTNFIRICELSSQSDLPLLVPIAKEILTHVLISAERIAGGLACGTFGSIFVAAIVGAQSTGSCTKCTKPGQNPLYVF